MALTAPRSPAAQLGAGLLAGALVSVSLGVYAGLQVAFHCLWSLGFVSTDLRVLAHGVLGCFFYGAYATKMLSLRLRGLPGWTLPVVGGTLVGTLSLLWLTASLWFFTRTGIPLT